ncbi:MAG: hypothetical protein GXX94_01285 [Chloroflexi bacterium]|nr:hypothetical protein [Chloroflexota bacterium]
MDSDRNVVDRVIKGRRSIRAFEDRAVSRAEIEDLLEIARWAPSGSNSQPWRVTVAAGEPAERLRAALLEAADGHTFTAQQAEGYRNRIASGPMAWMLDQIDEPVDRYLTRGSMSFYGAPVALVVSYPGTAGSTTPAGIPAFVTTLMLAAEARGLGTIWLGWPLGQPQIVRSALGIGEDEQLGAFVALGYPDRQAPVNRARAPRQAPSTFSRWIGWNEGAV